MGLVDGSHVKRGVASNGLDVDIHGVARHAVHVQQECQEYVIVMLA